MRTVRFLWVFAILSSILVLAQSNAAQLKLPTRLPDSKRSHPVLFPIAQRSKSALKPTVRARMHSPTSGLNFAPAATYDSGGLDADSVAVADVNGDGKLDLVVANESSFENNDGSVAVLLGNGDGTYASAQAYDSGGYYAWSIAVADINGDGKLDLVVANNDCIICQSGGIGVLLGNGDGTFNPVVVYSTGGNIAFSVAVADLNGDGKPDIVAVNDCGDDSCTEGSVGVLLGNGDGTFQNAVTYDSGGIGAVSVGVADLNGDGIPDIVASNQRACSNCTTGSVGVLFGNGDGTFRSAVTYSSGAPITWYVSVGDVNGDNVPDIVVASAVCPNSPCTDGLVGVLLGNGDGTFETVSTYDTGGFQPFSVVIADVNGDGSPDLVVANFCANDTCQTEDTAGVLLGNGDGSFQTVQVFDTGGIYAHSVTVADVNGDGKPDLVVANDCVKAGNSCGDGLVGVLINTSLTATTTELTSSLNPSNLGQSVTFTATVAKQKGFYIGTPTGTVTFFDGLTNLGSSSLNTGGVAVLQTGMLAIGTHSITATYNGDTDFAPSTSQPLSQVVQGAIAVISPTGLDFGNQTVGIVSGPQAVTLMNTGNIALTASIGITGTNGSDFTQTNNCPSSLPPNASCMVSVTFDPTAIGTRSANLVFTDNAPNSPQLVSLSGVGVLPAVTFSPTSLTFPTQVVYTNSKSQVVTLTNTGLGILKLTGGALSGQFGATTTCNGTLKSSASCTITVTFKPRSKGILNGNITVTDNAPDSPQKVPLTGVGTYVLLSPISVNFGTQPINTTSLPKYITFTNKGSGSVNFTGAGISITGTDAGDFAQTNNCGSSVATGASCKIKVTFTPSAQGTRTASVSISDDGGGSPQAVPLTGIGTP